MKKWMMLFLIALVGCATTPEEEGDSAYQKGKYDSAINHYDEALKSNETNYAVLLKKASAFEQAGKTDRALAAYSSLIKKYPKQAGPRLARARLLYKTDDALPALRDIDRILTNPKALPQAKILALALQGEIYYRQDDPKKAMMAFDSALDQGEKNIDFKATPYYRRLLYNAARVAFGLGNFNRSQEFFRKYMDRKKLNGHPFTEDDYYFYALVLKYTGNFEEAEKYEAKLSPEAKARLSQK